MPKPKTDTEVKPNLVAKFEFQVIPRSQIKMADYNPRHIDPVAADKLKGVLEDDEVGLVDAPVFNKRTGNLVGGHQRVTQMDVIHEEKYGKGVDYEVPVHVIDVDEQVEKEINIILNNPSIAGEWDLPKLEDLIRNHNVNPFDVGFEVMDLATMYPTDTVIQFINQYVPESGASADLPGNPDQASMAATAEDIAKIKEARKEHKAADGEALRSDHMLVVVFENPSELNRAMAALHLTDNFVMADRFFAAVAAAGVNWIAQKTEDQPDEAPDLTL